MVERVHVLPSSQPCPAACQSSAPAVDSGQLQFQTHSDFHVGHQQPQRRAHGLTDVMQCLQAGTEKFKWDFFCGRRLELQCYLNSPCRCCSDSLHRLRHWELGTAAGRETQPKNSSITSLEQEWTSFQISQLNDLQNMDMDTKSMQSNPSTYSN